MKVVRQHSQTDNAAAGSEASMQTVYKWFIGSSFVHEEFNKSDYGDLKYEYPSALQIELKL